jgi:5-methylcytosine-specific restriction protein A
MEYPLCGQRPNGQEPVMSKCFDNGWITPSYQTDHVVPHKGNQALFWDRTNNWQSLCRECGAAKTRAGL